MRAEHNVPPADRFLVAWWRLSAKDAQTFNPNPSNAVAVSVVLAYCYADVPLPASYDVLFRLDNPAICESVDLDVVFAYPDGRFAWDRLEHGFKHVGVLQFKDGIPLLIQELPAAPLAAGMPAAAECIGICRSEDFPAIRDRRWSPQIA